MKQKQESSQTRQAWLQSFAAAFAGLKVLFSNERNFRVHLLIGIAAVIACVVFHVTLMEWVVVLLLIAVVLSAEAFNTSIEYLCDIISPNYHPLIKKIKDIAAGAVLICAVIAAVIGCVIFIPYLAGLL